MAIDLLKKVVDVAVSISFAYESSQEDGFQYTDLFQFIGPLSAVPELLKKKAEIKAQIDALDKAGKDELVAYAESTFDLTNDAAEAKIEAGFALVLAGFLFFKAVK